MSSPCNQNRLLNKVLALLQHAEAALNVKKCNFSAKTIDYLGHGIRPRCLQIATHTASTTKELNLSTNVSVFRSFYGLQNNFCSFISSFVRIATSLNNKLKKGRPKHFGALTEKELLAMHKLREKLVSPPILYVIKQQKKIHTRYRRVHYIDRMHATTRATWRRKQTRWILIVSADKSRIDFPHHATKMSHDRLVGTNATTIPGQNTFHNLNWLQFVESDA